MRFEQEAGLPVTAYPGCIFETIRVEEGIPLFWLEHMARMENSLKALRGQELRKEELRTEVSRLKLPALGGLRLILLEDGSVLWSIRDITFPGSAVLALATEVRDSCESRYRHKTWEYAERLQELGRARKDGCADSLYLTEKGFLAGNTISNIFFFREGHLCTPALDNGVLNGILRSILLEEGGGEEGCYCLEDLEKADAVFLSNSLLEIYLIRSVRGLPGYTLKEQGLIQELIVRYEKRKEESRRQWHG